MAELQFREALRAAMVEEMERDESIFLMGEEVAEYNGAYKVSQGMLERFGPKRVIDTPISENGFAGLCIGAAMNGLKPICEFMTWNFSLVAFDQLVNSAAKMYQMSAGQFPIPVVFRGPGGAAHALGSQHSQCFEALYAHIPGLKVVMPSTPDEGKGLLKAAIRDPDPIVFIESEIMYGLKGEVSDEEDYVIPLGQARITRRGTDVTVVSWSKIWHQAQAAAEQLAGEGISCEVIDLRTIRPLDVKTIVDSVRRTGRCVVVHEGWAYGGVGAEIVDQVQRHCFDYLDAPVARVHNWDVPMPYCDKLEDIILPNAERAAAAIRGVMYR